MRNAILFMLPILVALAVLLAVYHFHTGEWGWFTLNVLSVVAGVWFWNDFRKL